jgi:hypothetical protein
MKKNLLDQLNAEITLLENYGYYKSASILHKKFIREAQVDPISYDKEPRGDTYKKYFYNLLNSAQKAQDIEAAKNAIRRDGFLLEEDKQQLIGMLPQSVQAKPNTTPVATTANPATPTNQSTVTPTNTTEIVELANVTPITSQPQQPQQQLADPSQNLFNKLLNEAKYYLSINDFNNAATIRQQAAESEMYQNQKIAWEQQYNILVQNYSGTAPNNQASPQYNAQNQAQSDIYNAAKSIGLEYITPANIAFREQQIRQKLYQSGKLNANTQQLLRQISLSAYYISNPQSKK